LDFIKVKQSEREKAKRLAMSAAGAALESDVQIEARDAQTKSSNNKSKTFTPGEGTSAKEAFVANFTPDQKAAIKEMIANASTPAEIERIEDCVKRGVFPGGEGDQLLAGAKCNENVSDFGASSSTSLHEIGQRPSKRSKA